MDAVAEPPSGSTPVRAVDGVRESRVGDRLVLFHARGDKALVLNPTGAWLWSRIAAAPSAERLCALLREQFPAVTDEQARADVRAFLAELQGHGLLAG